MIELKYRMVKMKEKKYYLYEMNMTILNVVSIVLFLLMMALTLALYKGGIIHNWNYSVGILLILMIPYFILHEIFHSIAYVLHGASFKNITYGMHLEKGLLCCLCKQNVSKRNILTSLLYPFIFLGVLTYILGICIDPIKDFEYCEYDNPTAFGLYSSENLSKKKLFGLNYINTQDKLEINDLKKITVSKTSIIGFTIIILLGLLYTFVNQ